MESPQVMKIGCILQIKNEENQGLMTINIYYKIKSLWKEENVFGEIKRSFFIANFSNLVKQLMLLTKNDQLKLKKNALITKHPE